MAKPSPAAATVSVKSLKEKVLLVFLEFQVNIRDILISKSHGTMIPLEKVRSVYCNLKIEKEKFRTDKRTNGVYQTTVEL